MTIKKPKIEAIYPLNSLQQGFLFHHLMNKDDQGFLIAQCFIEGNVDIEKLQLAWKSVTLRHEIMRTSVHWRKIKRPILVVRPEKDILWSFLDWRETPLEQQDELLVTYKKELKKKGIVLEENPLSKISLIQKTDSSYYLLWESHHLLLDGWSSIIILRDAFTYYDVLSSGSASQLKAVPSYKSYSNWLKSRSLESASEFWSKTFNRFKKASVFQQYSNLATINTPIAYTYRFTSQVSEDIKHLAKEYRVTLNTFFQGIWSIALSRYFDSNDITFGNTVSGRSIAFPNIELMAGMFANVVPVRSILDPLSSFQSCLQLIQTQQQEARNYEYCEIKQISKWANIPENKALFDTLFIFEKSWENIRSGGVKVSGFKSGLTSTYSITATFKIEDYILYDLRINPNIITSPLVDWFLEIVPHICHVLLDKKDSSIESILSKLTEAPSLQL